MHFSCPHCFDALGAARKFHDRRQNEMLVRNSSATKDYSFSRTGSQPLKPYETKRDLDDLTFTSPRSASSAGSVAKTIVRIDTFSPQPSVDHPRPYMRIISNARKWSGSKHDTSSDIEPSSLNRRPLSLSPSSEFPAGRALNNNISEVFGKTDTNTTATETTSDATNAVQQTQHRFSNKRGISRHDVNTMGMENCDDYDQKRHPTASNSAEVISERYWHMKRAARRIFERRDPTRIIDKGDKSLQGGSTITPSGNEIGNPDLMLVIHSANNGILEDCGFLSATMDDVTEGTTSAELDVQPTLLPQSTPLDDLRQNESDADEDSDLSREQVSVEAILHFTNLEQYATMTMEDPMKKNFTFPDTIRPHPYATMERHRSNSRRSPSRISLSRKSAESPMAHHISLKNGNECSNRCSVESSGADRKQEGFMSSFIKRLSSKINKPVQVIATVSVKNKSAPSTLHEALSKYSSDDLPANISSDETPAGRTSTTKRSSCILQPLSNSTHKAINEQLSSEILTSDYYFDSEFLAFHSANGANND